MEWENLQERIEQIFQSQTCDGPEDLSEITPFIVTGIYLDDSDLGIILPYLSAQYTTDSQYVGFIGRYQHVPVFRHGSPAAAEFPPTATWRGVGFGYIPMDIVN